MRTLVTLLAASFFFFIALAGCDASAPDGLLTAEVLADDYPATTFIYYKADGTSVDLLRLGSSLTIELRENGVVAGRLFVPEAALLATVEEEEELDEDFDGDFDEDLAGTFTINSDDLIRFDMESDTFVRDANWRYDEGTLSTNSTVEPGLPLEIVIAR